MKLWEEICSSEIYKRKRLSIFIIDEMTVIQITFKYFLVRICIESVQIYVIEFIFSEERNLFDT
ncbi:MAG: hypothetical protein ACE5SW_06605 [Nitrososphaeraceae archaeon]